MTLLPTISSPRIRRRLLVTGIVQGVGFRPAVYRLARSMKLNGWVRNDGHGVTIEIEGSTDVVEAFPDALRAQAHGPAVIHEILVADTDLVPDATGKGRDGFVIDPSDVDLPAETMIAPDMATCPACLSELADPADRRYGYPFLNCTHCGPRYSIVRRIPYDRPFTSMSAFTQCPDCQAEYDDPLDRRFHAQPNACPVCGPRLSIIEGGRTRAVGNPVAYAQEALAAGRIVAIRGIGGFHLAVDPCQGSAVRELRQRKLRTDKPFALMARSVPVVERFARISPAEKALLQDPSRPIVLVERLDKGNGLAPEIAPGQHTLGFMLPYTPLHHLLLDGPLEVLVMTSANQAEEPILTEADATHPGRPDEGARLSSLADVILTHDRDIVQRCDDSVWRVGPHGPFPLRRSRGYVPSPVRLAAPVPFPMLAVGGQLKNTVAVARGRDVVMSQHIGDLDNPLALRFFEETIHHLCALLQVRPQQVVCDLHPDYLSTRWAREYGLPLERVQHHHAHLAGVLAEHDHREAAVGLILDGTGFGTDGTIWGGELLLGTAALSRRVAHLQPMMIPGGETAIREPWRLAAALLHRRFGPGWTRLPAAKQLGRTPSELALMDRVMDRSVNAPLTTSAGRLFDGVAALLGFTRPITYEAQAAIELETLSRAGRPSIWDCARQLPPVSGGVIGTDDFIDAVLDDLEGGVAVADIAARFHASLAHRLSAAAMAAASDAGISTCALSGGVFQNAFLLERVVEDLEAAGIQVLLPSRMPANDGGLAFGQIAAAAARYRSRDAHQPATP